MHHRPSAHISAAILLLAAICTLTSAARADAPKPPNVVLIVIDDFGWADSGCYGSKFYRTPHIDRLASGGMRFTAAYAACPVCSPTRAALMTGKSPARLHLTTFLPGRPDCPSQKLLHPKITQHLPLEEKTLAEYLKEAGYATGCFGKWHLGGKGEYDLTAKAIEFVGRNRDQPFFLYLAHNSPHIPYAAKPELVRKNAGAFEPTYAAVIESLDETVGLLLRRLDELKLAGDTI